MQGSLFFLIPGRKERQSSKHILLQKLRDNIQTSREEEMRIHGGTEMSIGKTNPKLKKLNVTDVVDYVFCKTGRLLWLKKNTDLPIKLTWEMERGTNEHEVRRLLAEAIKFEYQLCKDATKLADIDYMACINGAIDDGLKLGRSVSPKFFLGLTEMRPELSYRLEREEKARLDKAIKMAKKGNPISKIVETLLPWQQELGVGSPELGIRGRIDQLYRIDDVLVPVDFKTYTDRFSSFIRMDAFREQLILYAILLEKQYRGTKSDTAIIEFTEDFTSHKFNITKNDKKNAIKHIKQARDVLEKHQVPPKLSGLDAIKCSKCYFKDHCFSFEKEGE